MQRTWTEVGFEYTNGQHSAFERVIAGLAWKELTPQSQEGMMPAQGIQEAIKQLRLPGVSAYAISAELAPCGFYGIRAHYKNGMAQVYLVDHGDGLTPVASDFEPIGE